MNKKGTGKQDVSKRTYILPNALLERLEMAAERERRPIGRQLEVFLERALNLYEQEAKAENEQGPWEPTLLAAA